MIFWLPDILDLGGTKISAPIQNFWYQKNPKNLWLVIPPPLLGHSGMPIDLKKNITAARRKKYVHTKIQCNLYFNNIFVIYTSFLTKLR